jgi:hypothetical protein
VSGALLGTVATHVETDNLERSDAEIPPDRVRTVNTFRIVKGEPVVFTIRPAKPGDPTFQNKTYRLWLTKLPRQADVFPFPTWVQCDDCSA